MKILLSIKPQYVEEIFNGSKLYEYRKTMFKRKDISRIVVYSSSPVCKVVGEFDIEDILSDTPDNLWRNTSSYSGITEAFFRKYFNGRQLAYAIKIRTIQKYSTPRKLQDLYPGIVPPQSYRYVND